MSDKNNQDRVTPLDYYLSLGGSGQFPLFYKDWFGNINLTQENYKLKNGTKILNKYFKKISKYRTLDKKKTAISAMNECDREEFLNTFFYVLEEKILNSEYKYH